MIEELYPISAFTPPPDGVLTIDGQKKFLQDFRVAERYREYRDCGFTEIIFSGETKYCGEPFEDSQLKRMLDLAQDADLRAIVFDERIMQLTVKAKRRIVGELFSTKKKFYAYVAQCLADYADHPAFYGISIVDEPMIAAAGVLKDICAAVHAAQPHAFVHTCFLPFIQDRGRIEGAFGKGYRNGWAAYRNYIRTMSQSGIGYFGYDAYPFGMWDSKNDTCAGYVRNMQEAAQTAQKCGVPFHMTIQSFSSGKNDELRRVDEADLNWQSNLALAFGCRKIYYFTYWRFTTRQADFFTSAIMDDDGTKLLYDEAQRNNALIRRTARFVGNLQYVCTKIIHAPHENKAMQGIKETSLPEIYAVHAQAPLLINKLAGESTAYCLLNLRDPYEKELNALRFRVRWSKEEAIGIVKNGERMLLQSENGWYRLVLSPGEAVWILRGEKTTGEDQ